jgi:succinylornithine aminotransferase|tara:strand:- start:2016 stop:3203 length:1188 start_codon:yes stop_codon:yes gene_type:complete
MINANDYSNYMVPFYAPADFIVKKAKGSLVWSANNKKYIDFTGGIAVTNLGHCNDELIKIMNQQSKNLWHLSNLYMNEPSVELAKKLCKKTFADKVFFCNSGAESIEASIKIARKYCTNNIDKSKNEILSFTSSFHGRTMLGIALAKAKHLTDGFAPLPKGIKNHTYNDFDKLEDAFSDKTAAVILELVQWQSGITKANKKFITKVKQLSKKYNALVIIDEVQSGVGRTGTFFAYEQFNIAPDILCFAKGMANGFPIGGILTSDKISDSMTVGSHGTTFGGGPIACAIGSRVVDIISKKAFLSDVLKKEKKFLKSLNEINSSYRCFNQISSAGLWVSVELSSIDIDDLIKLSHKNGLMVLKANATTIRFSPSLIIEDHLIEKGLEIFKKSILQLQ